MGTIRSILLALGLTACSQSGWGACIPPDDRPLAAGTWAGESGYFIVSHPDGSADVDEPCTSGIVDHARVKGGEVNWTWIIPADSGGYDSRDSLVGTVCGDRLTGRFASRTAEFTFVKGWNAEEVSCD